MQKLKASKFAVTLGLHCLISRSIDQTRTLVTEQAMTNYIMLTTSVLDGTHKMLIWKVMNFIIFSCSCSLPNFDELLKTNNETVMLLK